MRDWFIGKLTYDEMTDQLNELLVYEGIDATINRNQIWRWCQRQRAEMERIQRANEKADLIVSKLVGEGKDVGEAAEGLCKAILFESLLDADSVKATNVDEIASVAHSLGRLATSKVAREKWEFERRKKIEDAVGELKLEMQTLLAGMPELTAKLLDVVETAKDRMLEKTA